MRRNNKSIIIMVSVLTGMVVLIVGLVVGIVLNRKNAEQKPNGDECVSMDGSSEQTECLSKVYEEEGGKEVVDESLGKIMDKALEKEEYYHYADMLNSRVSLLVADNKCNEAIDVLKNAELEKLSFDELKYYYSFAKDVAAICEETALADEYTNKYEELLNVSQAEAPVPEEEPAPVDSGAE